jgi:hypothetical protein
MTPSALAQKCKEGKDHSHIWWRAHFNCLQRFSGPQNWLEQQRAAAARLKTFQEQREQELDEY